MTSVFAAILGIIKAIPILDKWVSQFFVWYTTVEVAKMRSENRAAIKKAIEQQDQIDLEKALGNPNAGEPTHYPGSVIIDKPPGLP